MNRDCYKDTKQWQLPKDSFEASSRRLKATPLVTILDLF